MPVHNNFTFSTWNAASDERDYTLLFRDRKDASPERPNIMDMINPSKERIQAIASKSQKSLEETTQDLTREGKEMEKAIGTIRKKLLKDTAENLIQAADVFALQEVSGDDREDIQVFKEKGFEIIRPPVRDPARASLTDTAIAIKKKKFKKIENRSVNDRGFDIAIAVATDISSKRKVAFISAHINGFDLEITDQKLLKDVALQGDEDVSNLIGIINQRCSDCDAVFIGADMNDFPGKRAPAPRFSPFRADGFTIHRTQKPTSHLERNPFTGKTVTLQDRELDYIFFKENKPTSLWTAFFDRLFKRKQIVEITQSKTSLTLDPTSPSDHIPVFVKVSTTTQSLFTSISNSVRKLFKIH